ncbi:hypothetical protein CEXT_610581 [Caerostris extrusa]|uniref:Uncharacterized protein n=1 Tax=Caerostris extrusa TaxID=172846 RepID=A0AAV4RZU8_CAEEX|nr:hypothetical protein CEXT_610581 [Caerostris extrusa]
MGEPILTASILTDTSIEVINELNSHHMPVITTLDLNCSLAKSTQRKFTNWHNYNYTLQHTTLPMTKMNSIEEAEQALNTFTILNALDNSSRPNFNQPGISYPQISKTSKIETSEEFGKDQRSQLTLYYAK